MKFFHLHHDPNWQVHGCWFYYECKCGARRIHRAYSNLMGPSSPNWPQARNSHGLCVDDSGWVHGFTGPIGLDIPINWSPPSAGLRVE